MTSCSTTCSFRSTTRWICAVPASGARRMSSQATIQAVLVGAVYDGVARAARDWLIDFSEDPHAVEPRRAAGDAAAGAGDRRRHRGEARGECAPARDLRTGYR